MEELKESMKITDKENCNVSQDEDSNKSEKSDKRDFTSHCSTTATRNDTTLYCREPYDTVTSDNTNNIANGIAEPKS